MRFLLPGCTPHIYSYTHIFVLTSTPTFKELVTIDNDVKGKFNQYSQVKNNFTALQRKQT